MNDNYVSSDCRFYIGCAILWKSSLSYNVKADVVANKRVSIVLINIHDTRVLLCYVYMPCSTSYDRDNIDIYNSVFNDIFDSYLCNNVDNILIEGDFTTEIFQTQSSHTISLNQMCAIEFTKCAQDLSQFSIDYT